MTIDLLRHNRFFGLFWTQFLGAANDNFFKNALVILTLFRLAEESGPLLVTASAGILILPFFLFSALAGQIADKFERGQLTRIIKIAEILIMAAGVAALWAGHVPALLSVLFCMGTQSAFFGPIKYGIIPDLVGRERLMDANALIEAGTFLAILFGTIFGGILILKSGGLVMVSAGMLLMAMAGYWASRQIPRVEPADPSLRLNFNLVRQTSRTMAYARENRHIWMASLGVSWFWFCGAVYLTQVPTFTKELIGGNENLVTYFLTLFSIGIGVGSLLAARITKGRVRVFPVPFAAIFMAIFGIDLVIATNALPPGGDEIVGILGFLSSFAGWRVTLDLVGVAIAGGLFVVPLFAGIQAWAHEDKRARVIAALNIISAAFVVASSLITLVLQTIGLNVAQIFMAVAVANVAVAVYVIGLLPDQVLRGFARSVFTLLYRVEVHGRENVDKAGDRAVIVVNHLSLLDAPIMLSVMEDPPFFAIYTGMAKKWWVRPFLGLVEAFPVDPSRPMAVKHLANKLKGGGRLVIFPEGRLTETGALMKIYDGPAVIADKADAMIVPARIEGAEQTPFSRLNALQVRRRWFPKIKVTFGSPQELALPDDLKGPARREGAADRLYDIMCSLQVETSGIERNLFRTLIAAANKHGHGTNALEDAQEVRLSYGRLLAGSLVLGNKLKSRVPAGKPVGIMLPNAAGTAVTFMALHSRGHVPAMINFTSGARNILAGCRAAGVLTILTSRAFIEQAKLESLIEELKREVEIVYLDDVRRRISIIDRLRGLWQSRHPERYADLSAAPDDAAVILFTSGSEGTPKGVVLTHKNVLASCAQAGSRVDFSRQDKVFNVLPVFHCFGLTGGLLLPLFYGVPVFLYPSPLHYKIVPEAVYNTNSTVLYGTDTFLAGYARRAHPYDFRSLRFVLAGAEKLKPETQRLWMDKFGIRLFEGYGLTETAPAAALNTPMHYKSGSVGRLVPLMDYRLEPVEGMSDEGNIGRLFLRGPNVMAGYLNADRPEILQPPEDGWFDTGDIVEVDAEGFVHIKGRAKRFAKIAGEMVSLAAVEALAAAVRPAAEHAVAALPAPRKGERLILLTTAEDLERGDLQAEIRHQGGTELMLPAVIVEVDAIPLLGTGKIDLGGTKALAERLAGHPTTEPEPA